MEEICCKLKVNEHWPRSMHPLHLMTDKVKWMTRFGECDSPVIISLSESSRHRSIFVALCLDNCPDAEEEFAPGRNLLKESPVVLTCNQEFLAHYDIECSSRLYFNFVSTFPLDRVVIAAMTNEAHEWAKQQGFETGLLVACTCNQSLLVRCDDTFLSPPLSCYGHDSDVVLRMFRMLRVVDCSPIRQGVLNINTSIVLVKTEDFVESTNDLPATINCDELKLEVTNDIPGSLSLKHGHLSTVYCSESVVSGLGMEDGSVASFTVAPPSGETMQRQVFVQSLPDALFHHHVEKGCSADQHASPLQKIKISSVLWFNLTNHARHFEAETCNVQLCPMERDPPFTREVHLSLVLSPGYSPSGCFDQSLLNVFRTRQIVKVGDVISIDVQDDYDFYEAADVKSHRCKEIFYQVKSLEDEAEPGTHCIADTKHTSIYQDGTVNSYVPANPSSSRSGLDGYVRQLADTISPYLDPSIQLDHVCTVLLSGQPGCGKRSVISEACNLCHLHQFEINCHLLTSDTPGASEAKINDVFRKASQYAPCCVIMESVEQIGNIRESGQLDNRVIAVLARTIGDLPRGGDSLPVVVMATTSDQSGVATRNIFLHQIEFESANESARMAMTRHTSQCIRRSRDVDFPRIAKQTAGFVFGDFWELMRRSVHVAHRRIIDNCAVGRKMTWREERSLSLAGVTSSNDDVMEALRQMQSERADAIGVPKVPEVTWEDIGGLAEVKSHILDTIQLPLDHPELLSGPLRRSGLLLYGPPGTGKTLLAKAVASQCSLSFLSVKGPELINMFVGQSEANVRRVFERARDAAPCVVFFDELDALASNRGRSGDSGGVMDRVVSQLLAELDGVGGGGHVFVIAASNRPDLIDPALLRPGRLDKLIYVGMSESKRDKVKVLQAQTRKLNLSPQVCLDDVVDACPGNLTGADFYSLTMEAAMSAVRRRIRELEEGGVGGGGGRCVVEQEDLLDAARRVVPSVGSAQMENYRRVQQVMMR